jgi:hypothetical protein
MSSITQKRLKEILHYNPETGVFTRKITKSAKIKVGSIAGGVSKNSGYRLIMVDGKLYRANRLAWLYMEGYFPEYEVDHENNIRHDDRWCNLRHVTHQCNMKNQKFRSNNTSGITGVSWDSKNRKWRASISVDGKTTNLGRYADFEKAVINRYKAEIKYNYNNCNNKSSAYKYIIRNKLNI